MAEKSYERAKSSLMVAETARMPLPDKNLPLQYSWPKEPILSLCQKAWKRITGFSGRLKE